MSVSHLFINYFCRILICTLSPAGSPSALLCTLTISPLTRKTRSACSFRGDQHDNIHVNFLDSAADDFCPSSSLRISSSCLFVCITFHFQISQGRRSHHHSNRGDDRGRRREMGFSANTRLCSSWHQGIQGQSYEFNILLSEARLFIPSLKRDNSFTTFCSFPHWTHDNCKWYRVSHFTDIWP